MEMKTNSAITLAALDAAAIVGVSIYFNNELNKIKESIKEDRNNSKSLNSWLKETIDPHKIQELEKIIL